MTLNSRNVIFLLMCIIQGCTSTTVIKLKGPFFGIKPTDTPQLVVPEIVSSNLVENNGTFSPDGKEFYYTLFFPKQGIISFMKMNTDNSWSKPAIAKFSGVHSDVDPLFSPDGSRIYFTSNRPVTSTASVNRNNIWYVERVNNEWSAPKFIPLTEDGDYYSSVTKSGVIYFNVWRTGDIYKAVKSDSNYVTEKISKIINTDKDDGDPFISPEEDYIIFRGNNRTDTFGAMDLYISFNINNEWTEPENLGEPINSSSSEICPLVTADGKLFIFSSNRMKNDFKPEPFTLLEPYREKFKSFDNGTFNIYSISADFIELRRKKHQIK
jgi:Tol biopolymer transport system component